MKKLVKLFKASVFILIPLNVLAGDLSGKVSNRLRYEGDDQREQYRVNFKYKHEFGESSCLSINAQVLTGARYGSSNNDFSDDFDLNLRRVYLDVQCLVDKSIQIGAIPTSSINNLDIDKNAWIDGMKVSIDLKGIIDKFSLTYGSVNPDSSPNILERFNEEKIRFVRAEIQKQVSQRLRASLLLTDYNDETIIQGMLEVSTEDLLPFADNIKIYSARDFNGKSLHNGLEFKKQIGKYSLGYGYYDIDEQLYPISSFQGSEDAFYISLSRTFKDRIKVSIRARKGKTENRVDAQVEYQF